MLLFSVKPQVEKILGNPLRIRASRAKRPTDTVFILQGHERGACFIHKERGCPSSYHIRKPSISGS